MNKLNFLLFATLFSSAAFAQPTIELGSDTFFLAFADQNKNEIVQGFFPVGETGENWSQLIVIRKFPKLNSPEKYIDELTAKFAKAGTGMPFSLIDDPNTGSKIIHYVTNKSSAKSGELAWNFFQAKKSNEAKGIIVYQYVARRTYNESIKEILESFDVRKLENEKVPLLLSANFSVKDVEQEASGNPDKPGSGAQR